MSDEADSGGSSPEPETPKEQLSEIQVTLGEHSKFIADNFDKLYDEIELLKVKICSSWCQWCQSCILCNLQRMQLLVNSTWHFRPDQAWSCEIGPHASFDHLHYVRHGKFISIQIQIMH